MRNQKENKKKTKDNKPNSNKYGNAIYGPTMITAFVDFT